MEPTESLDSLLDLRRRVKKFAVDRNWTQFHTPKNLAMALLVEAGELAEHFQWVETGEKDVLHPDKRQAVSEEVADCLLYLVLLADRMDIDIYKAALKKIAINSVKYPTDVVYGVARKYTDY